MSSILEKIKDTSNRFVNDLQAFSTPVILTSPSGISYTTAGFFSKHHNALDMEANRISSKMTSIALHERDLVAKGVVVRNASGNVALLNYICQISDSSETSSKYIVRQMYPDELIGIIVLILGDYATN